MGKNVEHQIAVEADTSINGDGFAIAFGIVARVFQSLPRALEKETLLRVHRLRFFRTEPKEAGIKEVDVFEGCFGLDVVGIGEHRGIDAFADQLFISEERYTLHPIPQPLPKLTYVFG